MSSSSLFTFTSVLINSILFFTPTTSQPTFLYDYCVGANYTTNNNIPFTANLNLLLSSLSSNASSSINNGFYNFTTGRNQYKVYGLFLCRGDVTTETCQNCVEAARENMTQLCPVNREAVIWYEECMLRYSNRSIFSNMEEDPGVFFYDPTYNVSDPDGFNQILSDLMDKIITRAVSGSSFPRMFATGEAKFSVSQDIYGLVQCTPDLSETDCDRCLREAIPAIQTSYYGMPRVALYQPSCVVRCSDARFFQLKAGAPPPAPHVPPPPPPSSKDKAPNGQRNSFQPAIVIAIPIVIAVTFPSIVCFLVQRRKQKKNVNFMDEITNVNSSQFDLITIKSATDNFSDVNKLGAGGFGAVYKGRLSDGQEIAVKRLSINSAQGEAEFKTEVALLAKLQHRNLVRLLGFCLQGKEKQLIYEFVPNRSLDYFLFELVHPGQLISALSFLSGNGLNNLMFCLDDCTDPIKRKDVDWGRRYKIIEGIARGILYLHEDSHIRIIHRDLKPSNILLDADMNPKISDFGTARLVLMDQTAVKTKKVVGTYGYLAPEYAIKGLFSMKSDVFSFGVIVLEIISGKKISGFYTQDSHTLLEYAWRLWHEGKGLEFIDPLLNNSSPTTEVLKCLLIGLLCVQEDGQFRPTMSSVVVMLKKRLNSLPQPRQPAYALGSSGVETDSFSASGKNSSVNEATLSSFPPR